MKLMKIVVFFIQYDLFNKYTRHLGVEEIKLENFMVVIQQLSNETNICDPLDIVEGSMH